MPIGGIYALVGIFNNTGEVEKVLLECLSNCQLSIYHDYNEISFNSI